jgi:hypothetical protein
MAFPWLRLLNTLIGVTDFAMTRRVGSVSREEGRQLAVGRRTLGNLEAHLAGVVVAALKEAFDRDSRRLDLEREHLEAERLRAERMLRLELVRQTGERELARLRLIAGVAIVGWMGTLFISTRLIGGPPESRVALAAGWAMLLGALVAAFVGQSRIGQALARLDLSADTLQISRAGALASWLIVVGLALIGAAVLIQ